MTKTLEGANRVSLERQHQARISVKVPGSTANIGPGFDTLGLAVSLYTHITFLLLEEPNKEIPVISLTESTDRAWLNSQALLDKCIARYIAAHPQMKDKLRIVIDSEVPVGRGLGSSASLIIAALWASHRLAGRIPTPTRVLDEATEIEGHPDNVGACLYGGFVVTGRTQKAQHMFAAKMRWPDKWCPIFVVPPAATSTAHARHILPKVVSRADAIWNLQHASLLVSAVNSQDENMLKEALSDRLHEQHRYGLVPHLPIIKKILKPTPAIGCVLSGAGSSVMVLVDQKHKEEVKQELQNWIASLAVRPMLLDLKVDQAGVQEVDD